MDTLGLNIDQTPLARKMSAQLGLMRGPVFDSMFLFIPLGLCFFAYYAIEYGTWFTVGKGYGTMAWLILIYSSYFSTGHAMSTFSRVVWNKESLKKYHWLLAATPLAIAGVLYVVTTAYGVAFIMTTYFILQWFHYVRQGYGLSQVYRHKSQLNDPPWLHQAVIYGLPLWGVLHRMTTPELNYLFNTIYTLPAVKGVVLPVAVLSCMAIVYWLWRRAVDISKGKPVWGYTLFVISHLLVFYCAFIYIEDATIGWIGSAFWHATQYLFFVWHFNRRQAENKGKFTNYFQYVALSSLIFVPSFMYFGHYMTQGWVWVQANLGLTSAAIVALNLAFLYNHYLADALLWRRQKASLKNP